MNPLVDIRAAQVSAIAAALPSLKTVETHRGRFDNAAEIRRYATRSPAVLVACLGFDKPPTSGGLRRFSLRFAWFLVTRDAPTLTRDEASLALAPALEAVIDEADWGLDYLSAPSAVEARNLYSGSIDKLGVALWGLSFRQTADVDVLSATDYAALNDFLTFHQDLDVAPADGQIDITETDTLPQ